MSSSFPESLCKWIVIDLQFGYLHKWKTTWENITLLFYSQFQVFFINTFYKFECFKWNSFVPLGSDKLSLQWRLFLGKWKSESDSSGRCRDCRPVPRGTWGSSDAWSVGWSEGTNRTMSKIPALKMSVDRAWWCSGSLTWPCWSSVLLVSLTLRKDNDCFIQWLPVAGESGCMNVRHGGWGSAFPATSHWSFFHCRGDKTRNILNDILVKK